MKIVFRTAVYLSLFWNLSLVVGVVIDASYALPRAAGGQFENFPTYIRLVYALVSAIVLYQLYICDRFYRKSILAKVWLLRVFFFTGILSVIVNIISRSELERWNFIPALIIAFSFLNQVNLAREKPHGK